MKMLLEKLTAAAFALAMISAPALAQSKVTIAVGGGACLCYLPTVLAKQLGEYEKAGVDVEMIDFKGGSQALQAVIGGSAVMTVMLCLGLLMALERQQRTVSRLI